MRSLPSLVTTSTKPAHIASRQVLLAGAGFMLDLVVAFGAALLVLVLVSLGIGERIGEDPQLLVCLGSGLAYFGLLGPRGATLGARLSRAGARSVTVTHSV